METIYVVHIIKHSLRHMPEFTHAVGGLKEIESLLTTASYDSGQDNIHSLIAHASKLSWNENKDFQLVHSYDRPKVGVICESK